MVINCSQNRITNHGASDSLKDKLHKMMGLYLEEDDHSIVLRDKGKAIARWSATGAKAEAIQDAANLYILNSCSGFELRLLHFWKHHPQTRLSLYSVANTLDTERVSLRHAIKALVEKGILEEQCNDNGVTGSGKTEIYLRALAEQFLFQPYLVQPAALNKELPSALF